MSISNLSRTQAVERMERVQAEMESLTSSGKHRLPASEQARFDELGNEFDDLRRHVQRCDQAGEIAAGLASGRYRTESGVPTEFAGPQRDGTRDAAMRTLDRHVDAGSLPARSAEMVEKLAGGSTWAARWAAAVGDPDYATAFVKLLSGDGQGHLRWSPAEAEAFRRVEAVRDEQRSLGLSAGGGDTMVPLHLDPSVLLSNAGSTSSLRQICRTELIATDSWHGVSSAGVAAEWRDEFAESSDATPTLTGPVIPVHRGSAFVPFSFEVEGDAVNFLGELQKLLMDAAIQLTDTAFTTGSGSGQPRGFITALAAASPSVKVAPAVAETLTAEDVFAVQNALPPRFQPNASWLGHLRTLNNLRQFETSNGALKFPSLQDGEPSLLGRRAYEHSNMDGTIDPAATESNYVLAYGDFKQFCIVDRIGTTIERVGHLFGSNRRPTGERGALLWFRTGSDVLVPNAFRMLSIPTTA